MDRCIKKTLSALVIEDDSDIREILKEMLEDFGVQVTEAEHGKQAISVLKTNHFDIIFSDAHMPEMGIEQFTAHLGEMFQGSEITPRLVLVTGDTLMAEELAGKGIDQCIGKPFKDIEIESCLMSLLETKTAA